MIAEGKTQREVAEHFGLKDKYVVKKLLKRQREKQRKLEAGIMPHPKGRPLKDAQAADLAARQTYEIERLRMENKLLRDFLRSGGRTVKRIRRRGCPGASAESRRTRRDVQRFTGRRPAAGACFPPRLRR